MIQFALLRLARAVAVLIATVLAAILLSAVGPYLLSAGGTGLARGFGYGVLAAVQGDFGVSQHAGTPVADLVGDGCAVTAELLATSLVLMLLIGPLAGVLLAMGRGSFPARMLVQAARAIAAAPSFLLAGLLAVPIALNVSVWPLSDSDGRVLVVLAAIAAAVPTASLAIHLHDGMAVAQSSFYARFAYARGLPASAVLGHAVLNGVRALADTLAAHGGALVAAEAVVEIVFQRPGLGAVLVDAAASGDAATFAACLPFLVAAVLLLDLLADLLRLGLDPRLRTIPAPAALR